MESIVILIAAHLAATLSRWEPRARWQKRVRTAGRVLAHLAHLAALGGIGWLFYGTPVVEALTIATSSLVLGATVADRFSRPAPKPATNRSPARPVVIRTRPVTRQVAGARRARARARARLAAD